MKKRHMVLMVGGLSLVGFATPNLILGFLKHNAGAKESPPVEGLVEREARYKAGLAGRNKRLTVNYLEATKAAINREVKKTGQRNYKVSQVVFTSEKVKWIAGQKQVQLTFIYQLQLRNGKSKKLNGSIHLASDEAGNLFDTAIEI